MNHLTDAQLRAYLDGELSGPETGHIETCTVCQERLPALLNQKVRMAERLSFLNSASEEGSLAVTARPALDKFNQQRLSEKETSMTANLKNIFGKRLVWLGLTAVLVLAIALSVPQVRAWAGQFLGLFRVQQVAVLPIDTTSLDRLNGNSAFVEQIGQLMSDSVNVTKKPGQPEQASDAASASQMAGFQVRLPASQAQTPQLYVQGSAAFSFVINRSRAQTILDEAGRSDLVLPQSVDGAKVSVNIPASVSAGYGNCPTQASANERPFSGSNGRKYAGCIMLVQMPSPTVETPPDVDVQQLAEIALQFTGMSPDQAHQFSQSIDWTSSLVIPIPKNAATYQQVSVDGVTGQLIQRPADDAPEYVLVWVKNGIIYGIASLGSNSAPALDMANSMK